MNMQPFLHPLSYWHSLRIQHKQKSKRGEPVSSNHRPIITAEFFQKYIFVAEQEISESIPCCIQGIISSFFPFFTVHAIGTNKYGQFGNGSVYEHERDHFINLHNFGELMDSAHSIFLNNERIMIQSQNKEIFVSGNNYFGELGQPIAMQCCPIFTKLSPPLTENDEVEIISQGILSEATFIYTTKGDLFGCGRDINDYLGQFTWKSLTKFNHRICNRFPNPTPTATAITASRGIETCDRIIDIQCAYKHVLFLTASGRVWAVGDNDLGQCGQSPLIEHVDHPSLVQGLPKPIKSMKVGQWHNLILDSSGNIWVFGSNDMGQLGVDQDYHGDVLFTATKNTYFDEEIEIVQIECGLNHSVCIDAQGRCYGFGRNHEGQIGVHTPSSEVYHPMQVSINQDDMIWKVVQVSCGWNHTVLLTEENEVVTFGSNSFSQCSPALKQCPRLMTPHVMDKEKELLMDDPKRDRIDRILAESTSTMVIVSRKLL